MIWKQAVVAYFNVLSPYSPVDTEEHYEKPHSHGLKNLGPPKHEARLLTRPRRSVRPSKPRAWLYEYSYWGRLPTTVVDMSVTNRTPLKQNSSYFFLVFLSRFHGDLSFSNSTEQSLLSEANSTLSWSRNPQPFIEPESPLSFSQEPVTAPNTVTDESSPPPQTHTPNSVRSTLILSYLGLSLLSFPPFRLHNLNFVRISHFPMHVKCPAHFILFDLIILKISD
jgi:hypothetical protein